MLEVVNSLFIILYILLFSDGVGNIDYKAQTLAAIASMFAASVTALLAKGELKQKIQNWLAGVLAGMLASFVLRNANIADIVKEIIYIGIAAFVPQIWPELEKFAKRYTKKKTNDVARNDNT